MSVFHPLRVSGIRPSTSEAVVISFEVPESLADAFQYFSGQYLTIRKEIGGKEVRRAYSMCSSLHMNEPLQVAVKRVEGGLMSTFLNTQLKVGDLLDVMVPEGRFLLKPDPDQRKTYVMIAAGSGITPMLSMLKSVIEAEPKSQVLLFYGNRNEASIMFRSELESLVSRYRGQLEVVHVLSKSGKSGGKGLFGWMNGSGDAWEGMKGRLDGAMLNRLLDDNPPVTESIEYFICGPGSMNEDITNALKSRGVEKKFIHTEHFSSHHLPHEQKAKGDVDGAQLTVHLDGQKITTVIPSGVNILQHLLNEGYDPPYSCTSGSCASCIGKVISGKARMEVCLALDEEEVKDGFVLTCQAYPESAALELTFEV